MKVIEGEFRFVGEDEIRERKAWPKRRKRRLPGWVRWTLRADLLALGLYADGCWPDRRAVVTCFRITR